VAVSIELTRIEPGSYCGKVYLDGKSHANRDPWDTIYILTPFMDGVLCHQVHGQLSDEINVSIGENAFDMGWKTLYFTRATGERVTRYATYSHTMDGLDHYRVDLEAIFGGGGHD